MTPVFRIMHSSDWQRVPVKDVHYYKSPRHNHNHVLSMVITMPNAGEVHEIAYTFPYNYTRQQYQLAWIERLNKPFLRRDLLCRTPQLRRVDMLTITYPMSRHPLPTSQVHTPSPFWLRSRRLNESACRPDASRVVFISARVHPGETPASYVTEGLLDFLVSADKNAAKLREEIVWVVVSGEDLKHLFSKPEH
ncbi:hypothetical protein BSKO_09714 [Bryopsis sp. KO-2023]|nr:hypothetical protein BSKO_09714 [Bryopsis sp. KO-2023]